MATLEVVTGRVVNPGAAFALLTANTGQTLNVRDFGAGGSASLYGMWTQQATAGQVRLRSPRLHDDVQGIRKIANAASVFNLFTDWEEQRLEANDPLRFDMTGGAAETDSAALLIYYRGIGSLDQRLESLDTVRARQIDICGHVVDITGPVTAGDWSAGNVINSLSDNLKADTDYAVLGYEVSAECLAVALVGTDTGNIRIGGPGPTNVLETRDWFVRLSQRHGKALIPVFNSNNRGNTLAMIARNTAAGTVSVTFQLARLGR